MRALEGRNPESHPARPMLLIVGEGEGNKVEVSIIMGGRRVEGRENRTGLMCYIGNVG